MSLLEKWNADDEIDSDSSSALDEGDTSKSEADTAAVGDRFHGVHSLTLTSSSTILTARRLDFLTELSHHLELVKKKNL